MGALWGEPCLQGIIIVPRASSRGTDEDSIPCTSGLGFPLVSHSPEMLECCVPVIPLGTQALWAQGKGVLNLKGRPKAEQVHAHGLEPLSHHGTRSPFSQIPIPARSRAMPQGHRVPAVVALLGAEMVQGL